MICVREERITKKITQVCFYVPLSPLVDCTLWMMGLLLNRVDRLVCVLLVFTRRPNLDVLSVIKVTCIFRKRSIRYPDRSEGANQAMPDGLKMEFHKIKTSNCLDQIDFHVVFR